MRCWARRSPPPAMIGMIALAGIIVRNSHPAGGLHRPAGYRRAVGPTFVGLGLLGLAAGLIGYGLAVGNEQGLTFVLYWSAVAVVAVLGASLGVRRQALGADEPFWTPPTRRVVAAITPPFVGGSAGTVYLTVLFGPMAKVIAITIPPLWMALHGLALHAAGYFTLRGIRWLGWAFIGTSVGFGALGAALSANYADLPTLRLAHLAMGLTFGLGHLLAGSWIIVAERRAVP